MAHTRQIRHALAAITHTTPARRCVIQAAAEEYLSQVDRRRLPMGCNAPIPGDRANRIDAYVMRRGDVLARMLGIAAHPADEHLPEVARAVLTHLDTTTQRLAALAAASGQPSLIATLHVAAGLTRH